MPGIDGTGPSGTGPVGWRHGRSRPAAMNTPEGEYSPLMTNQEQAGDKPSGLSQGQFPYGPGRRMRSRIGSKFRGGE